MTVQTEPRYVRHQPGQQPKNGEVETIVRYARQDQFPPGTNLRDAARDSVIRYTRHYGLRFTWHHDFAGVLWQYRLGACGHSDCIDPNHGYWRQRLDIEVWRSEAIVLRDPAGAA